MQKIILAVMAIICFTAVFTGCDVSQVNSDSQLAVSSIAAVTTPFERMVFVNGELYIETGSKSELELRCGTPDGCITSQVDNTTKPSQDNQSNFGKDLDYQVGYENTIEVLIDGTWWVFEKQTNA